MEIIRKVIFICPNPISYIRSITMCSFRGGEMSWTLTSAHWGLIACNKDWRTKKLLRDFSQEVQGRRVDEALFRDFSEFRLDEWSARKDTTDTHVLRSFKEKKVSYKQLFQPTPWLWVTVRQQIEPSLYCKSLRCKAPVRNLLLNKAKYDLQWYDIRGKAARDHSCAFAQRVIFGTCTKWGTARLPGSLAVHYK